MRLGEGRGGKVEVLRKRKRTREKKSKREEYWWSERGEGKS